MPLNIVIPMAGRGSRFQNKGYAAPKPLIEIHGKPMIQIVINNLTVNTPHRFIFLCLKDHIDQYKMDKKLQKWTSACEIVTVDHVTEGAACTVLLAKKHINNDVPLMIANSDQWVDISMEAYLRKLTTNDLDGLIMTMTANHPKWSFVRPNDREEVAEVVEKKVISNEATVGIYNYRRGADFVQAAERMIQKNLRVNNEFYVAPVYNEMIADRKKIGFYNIGDVEQTMFGLGTPEDLEAFLKLPAARKAVNF